MTAELDEELVALLRKPLIAFVATVMRDGTPQCTPIWIDTDGTDVIFNTSRSRVKYRNIRRNPAVAISFVDSDNQFRMVEIRGIAEIVEEGGIEHINFMAKKYLGQDTYPFLQPGEERVIVRVHPKAIAGM